MLIAPEPFTRSVTYRSRTERRPGPPAFAAGHVRHVATIEVHPDIGPEITETSISPPTRDIALMSGGDLAVLSRPMEQHVRRILRFVEHRMNFSGPNRVDLGTGRSHDEL